MKKYSKLKTALAVAIMSFSMISTVIAADAPIELKGDVIEYNAQTDMAIATGGVTITRDGGILTGGQATYNFKTQEASITGGVTANQEDMSLKAESLISNINKEIIAKGSVVLTKADNTLTGEEIHYNQATNDISMPFRWKCNWSAS